MYLDTLMKMVAEAVHISFLEEPPIESTPTITALPFEYCHRGLPLSPYSEDFLKLRHQYVNITGQVIAFEEFEVSIIIELLTWPEMVWYPI